MVDSLISDIQESYFLPSLTLKGFKENDCRLKMEYNLSTQTRKRFPRHCTNQFLSVLHICMKKESFRPIFGRGGTRTYYRGARTRGPFVPITALKGLLSRSSGTSVLPNSTVVSVSSSYLTTHQCCLTCLLFLSPLLATFVQSSGWASLLSPAQAFSLLHPQSLRISF